MNRGPKSAFGWACSVAAGASWIYAGAVAAAFALHWQPLQSDAMTDWVALPVQGLALSLVAFLLSRRRVLADGQRLAWSCVLGFAAISPLATYVWNTVPRDSHPEGLGLGDVIYFVDYWMLTGAFAALFVRAGGNFRTLRTWLDAATMTSVQLVAVWSFFLGPSVVQGASFNITLANILAYSVTLSCMMTMGALLCLELRWTGENAPAILLVAASVATAAWEIMWLASWLTDRDFVGPFYNFGDVLSAAAVSSAVAATQSWPGASSRAHSPRRERVESFPAALAMLVSIALVAGSIATTRRWDAWILVVLVVLCAGLMITRQRSARAELRLLNRQLAQREADARLTELVRRSSDLILLVSDEGRVSFASPSTETMLGIPAAQVQNAVVVDLFGPDNSSAIDVALRRVKSNSETSLTVELRLPRAGRSERVIRMNASNQLANILINGIVLTLTDITEQRMLEREVLDIASRERLRLSADVHDGLGQRLFGISMLLQGVVRSPTTSDPAAQSSQLKAIVEHLNGAVAAARDLARGLSPLQVVRGSLGSALWRLARDSNASTSVNLQVDREFDEGAVDDFCAEHLYRIAQEAVTNALRHSACRRIDIMLRQTPAAIELSVIDDGHGFDPAAAHTGLGLRIMGYRARIIGGSLRVTRSGNTGSCVEVISPTDAPRDRTTSSGQQY